MELDAKKVFDKENAETLLDHLARIQCFFAVVQVAPTLGAFSSLQTTMRLHNEEVGSFLDMWNITPDILMESAGSPAVNAAVHRLATVLASRTRHELKQVIDANGYDEKKHMLTLVKYLLKPLLVEGEDLVVLNMVEYSSTVFGARECTYVAWGTRLPMRCRGHCS